MSQIAIIYYFGPDSVSVIAMHLINYVILGVYVATNDHRIHIE